ncbi:MAG: nuclear transport factor 2 family protein [Defluviicoccus sp.]|nr:nuclear transport factor 2 family protein [Defluviicoccus sp.]
MRPSREELGEWVEDFTEAFNRESIDEVMAYFADDAIYDEFHGERHVGKAAIRAAFEPQFEGQYGKMRFHTEDMFLDTETGKAMISWMLTVESGERGGGWRGLDLLHFSDGKLVEKHTYAKTQRPLIVKKQDSDAVRQAIEGG